MNRKHRRALEKKARKDGMDNSLAKKFVAIADGTGDHTPAQEICEGESVMLNIEAIKSRKNYDIMNSKYKEFVENNGGVRFHAHIEQGGLISLAESPSWLFWSGDLLKIDEEVDE